MKKILLIFVIIMCSTSYAPKTFSQSNWFWQSPIPTGSYLKKVNFVNENTGFAVGNDFTAIKSTNGGMNWFSINSNFDSVPSGVILNNALTSVFFINSETGFIGGNNLFKTTDGGNRWVYLNAPFTPITSVFFTGNTNGFVSGNGIAKTSDGGYTWSVLNTGIPGSGSYETINFPSNDTGYVSRYGIPSILLKTSNGGITWSIAYSINQLKHFYGIEFPENNTGYVSPYDAGYIMKTTNGGNSWTDLLYTSYIVSTSFTSVSTGYAYGENGAFYSTRNGGVNWSYSHIEHWASIDFASDTTGYLVGRFGLVWKTTNSGTSWDTIPRLINNLNSVNFISENSGFVAGNSGTLLKTTNGGINWMNISSDFNYDFNYIKFFDEYTGYLSENIILKTTDGGISWDSVAYYNSTYKVQFLNPDTGFVGSSGTIYKTVDGGKSWTLRGVPGMAASYRSIHFFDYNNGVVMFAYGNQPPMVSIYKTTDSGENWILMIQFQSNGNFGENVRGISFLSEQNGYLYGPAGFYKTADGGYSWQNIFGFPVTNTPYFYNLNIGYLAFLNDLYKTTNSGFTWNRIHTLSQSTNTYFFTSLNTGYTVGILGAILKTTNGGGLIVGVNNVYNNIPPRFSLEQNYPNPFNPITKITFSLPQNADVKLIVYDLLGREVRSIVNEQLSPGKYTYDFDGSNLPSGVYYYKLITDDFSETRKMVLLK